MSAPLDQEWNFHHVVDAGTLGGGRVDGGCAREGACPAGECRVFERKACLRQRGVHFTSVARISRARLRQRRYYYFPRRTPPVKSFVSVLNKSLMQVNADESADLLTRRAIVPAPETQEQIASFVCIE